VTSSCQAQQSTSTARAIRKCAVELCNTNQILLPHRDASHAQQCDQLPLGSGSGPIGRGDEQPAGRAARADRRLGNALGAVASNRTRPCNARSSSSDPARRCRHRRLQHSHGTSVTHRPRIPTDQRHRDPGAALQYRGGRAAPAYRNSQLHDGRGSSPQTMPPGRSDPAERDRLTHPQQGRLNRASSVSSRSAAK